MSTFDWLFSPSKTETKSEVKLPGYIEDASKGIVSSATSTANKPWQGYGGDLVADWDPKQQQAYNLSGTVMPSALQTGNAGLDMSRLPEFMNPFTQNVIDTSMSDMIRSANIAGEQMDNQFHSGGESFGDARQGAFDSSMVSDMARQVGGMSAGLNMQNYDQALGTLKALPGIEAGNMANVDQYLRSLFGYGGQAQAQGQAEIGADYGQFQEQRDWDKDRLSWLNSIVAGTPYGKTSTQEVAGASPLAQMTGGAMNIASMFTGGGG